MTGTGKTDLLHLLDEKGIDVLDLEGIAKNSGSTFGFITFDKSHHLKRTLKQNYLKVYFFERELYICRE